MLFLVSSILAGVTIASAATADQWRSRSIYQIVTDRFALGNGTLPGCDTSARKYCGGDWNGITNNLDYIQGMGFDAVWISPIVTQINQTVDDEPYHGFWTGNFDTVNEYFGKPEDLKALSSALHSREMYLMVDINVNNMAANSTPANVTWLGTFPNETYFHPQNFIQNSADQTQLEQSWLMDGNVILPDLNTEFINVTRYFNSWIEDLVHEYGVDGIRIQSAKNVRKDFWPEFKNSSGVFTLAEVTTNDTDYAAAYTSVLDSVLEYPTFYALQNAFSSPDGDLSSLAKTAQDAQKKYKSGTFGAGAFLENHDNPRMQSITQDQSLIMNAIAWTFVTDSIPIVYYGQEQGFKGSKNPDNREPLWPSAYNTNKPLVSHISALNAARKSAFVHSPDFHNTQMKIVNNSGHILAISKPPMLALLTNGGNASTSTWSVGSTGYNASQELIDALSCNKVTVDGNGGVTAQSQNGLPMVLLPSNMFVGSGLCYNDIGVKILGSNRSSPSISVSLTTLLLVCISTLLFVS